MLPDSDVEIVEYRGTNVPNTANKRHGRRSKLPFIQPKEIIEVPDSSDDEQEPRAGPSAPPRLVATRSQPLFLPESDDDGEENTQQAPIARATAPSREPTVPADPTQFYITQVSAIIPDVDPLHVATLVPRCNGNVVEQIVNLLLESSDYPKIQNKGKGKRKRDEDDEGGSGREKVLKLDYASKDRTHMGGHFYHDLAIVSSINAVKRNYPPIFIFVLGSTMYGLPVHSQGTYPADVCPAQLLLRSDLSCPPS